MENSKKILYIIGAGISGLIAAQVLESKGYNVVILEKSNCAGGRLKTIDYKGNPLDVGFQVLLDAYPLAQKYLDYEKLKLLPFLPGSAIFTKNGMKTIGDPSRNLSFLIPTLFSGIGSFGDKIKILRLNKTLKKKSIDKIFNSPEKTTLHYLQDLGFSQEMLNDFFKPFFTGIFLETELETSSRMFEFVYKMFAKGNAVIPEKGIAAIPAQLVANLKLTKILYGSAVKKVSNEEIHLTGGDVIPHEGVIIAGEASKIVKNLKNQTVEWRSCDCLYFEAPNRAITKDLIGLIADDSSLINNVVYVNQPQKERSLSILSVTVVKSHKLSEEDLVRTVINELKEWCGIAELTFIRRFQIEKALPRITGLTYKVQPSETELLPNVFLAGDYMLYGSLNAAMQSGELAAEGLIEKLEGNFGL